jgi:hypothetical protein
MKKILPAVSLLLLIAGAASAQTEIASVTRKEARAEKREIRKTEVSFQSKQQFMKDFADAKNPQWRVTKFFEEATFNNNNVATTAYYDAASQLVGTTAPKQFSDLPANAQRYINEHYKGYEASNIIMFDDNETNETDMIMYGTSFEDEDNYFVPLKNDKETIIVKVKMNGEVGFFKKI